MKSKFQEEYKRKLLSVEEAAQLIKSDDILIGGIACTEPAPLVDAIGKRAAAGEFDNVQYICMGPVFSNDWLKPEIYPHMRNSNAFIFTPYARAAINNGYADYLVNHGYELPRLITDYIIKGRPKETVKVLSAVTPMDKKGFFSYGMGPGYSIEPSKMENTTVIVQVNSNIPWIGGDNFIHISEIDHIVEADAPLFFQPAAPPTPEDVAIAELIAPLIDDGSTLQLGIGGMPNVLGTLLANKHDLGAHSEMMGDAFMHLWEAGVMTGKRKTVKNGKITACFLMGSKELYQWLDRNPVAEFYSQGWTNHPMVIAQNYKMVAINQALEIDLTGQISSEGIGHNMYSGTGGQANFVQGASFAPGGKSFMCLKSTAQTKEGKVSTIVPFLRAGTAVSTSRNDVQYVVTEYGIAQLKGKTFKQRAQELISVAHPDFRAELRDQVKRIKQL